MEYFSYQVAPGTISQLFGEASNSRYQRFFLRSSFQTHKQNKLEHSTTALMRISLHHLQSIHYFLFIIQKSY